MTPRLRGPFPEPAGKLALLALILVLHAPTLGWLARLIGGGQARLSAYLLLAAAALIALRWRAGHQHLEPSARPRIHGAPLVLFVGSQLLYLASAHWLDMHIVAATLLGVTLYAAAGLYLPASTWRRGLPGLLMLLAVLPFGELLETYVGMPARRLTAEVVEQVLARARIAAIPAEMVLVLEGGLVYVDAPCSGVRSLWTGLVFFAGTTWIERTPLGLGWVVRGGVFAALLVLTNILRVLAIVLLAPVAGLHQVARIVHEPLGILGFCVACGVAYLMLRTPRAPSLTADGPTAPELRAPLLLALGGLTFAAILVHSPRAPRPAPTAPRFTLIGNMIPLSDSERGLFSRVGHTTATKHRFTWQGHTGSVLAVHSTSWRAHHAPEVCLAGAGHTIDRLETWTTGPRDALRVATLDGGQRTALYWYQSRTRTTAELLTRVLAELTGDEPEWVMVSILVEGRWPVDAPQTRDLSAFIRASVDDALAARGSP